MLTTCDKLTTSLKLFYLIIIFLITAFFQLLTIKADTTKPNLVNIYFFHSNTCSHCQEEETYLNYIEKNYDNVKIYRYEISTSENNEVRRQVKDLYNIKTDGVPLTIIGATPYPGYSAEKSNLTFTKTIAYYSKYPYIDEVGELFQIETLPYSKIDPNAPTLDEFLTTYGNHKLIGNITTDDLDPSISALILGIFLPLALINIVAVIIAVLIIRKTTPLKTKITLASIFSALNLLFLISRLINHSIYTLIIQIITIILLMSNILAYFKHKNQKYLKVLVLIILALLSTYLSIPHYQTQITILTEIINLHHLTGLNQFLIYGNFLFPSLIIYLIIIIVSCY